MTTRTLLAALSACLTLGGAAALDFNDDLTFTANFLPTDVINGANIVVGYDATPTSFGALSINDVFHYDKATDLYTGLGFLGDGGSGVLPQVSHDGTVVAGSMLSPDFGGDPNDNGDGPYATAGVWTQTLGQPSGTGTLTDLLSVDSPLDSLAYQNYVLNVNPPVAFVSGSPFKLGQGFGVSGDGNTVVGTYYRKDTPGDNGGMPTVYDLQAGTTIALNPGTTADDDRGQVIRANYDGSVVVGFVDNAIPTIWVDGVQTELTHPDGNSGRATAVNDAGDRVAGFQRVDHVNTPTVGDTTQGQVVWDYDSDSDTWDRTTIGRLEGRTGGVAEVTGISGDGEIVVGFDYVNNVGFGGLPAGAGNTADGTFWTETTGLVNIEDFLNARGADLAGNGIEIGSIQGISPDGKTLLAWGFFGDLSINSITGIVIDLGDTPLNPMGDANLLQALLERFGGTAEYAGDTYTGDWNHDQLVTAADLNILLRNWDPALGSPPTIDVPEPGSLALMLGVGGLAFRRRRRD